MKKIAFFIPTLGQGGAEKVFLNLANDMVKRHEVTLVIQDASGVMMKELSPDIQVFKIAMKNKAKALLNLLYFISKNKPEVIISTLNIPNILNYIAHKISSHNYVLVTRQASPYDRKTYTRLIQRLINQSFINSDLLIVNSLATKNSVIKVIPQIDPSIIHTIYNPIFSDKLDDLSKEGHVVPDFLRNQKFILCVGRLETLKNYNLVIDSYSKCKATEEYLLVILGEGSKRAELEKQIERLNLRKRVFLLGNFENPYPFYKQASLFVSCSLWEGFGNVIVEALTFGLPIISTNSGAPNEILRNGEFGTVLPNFDSDGMAQHIDQVLLRKTTDYEKLRNRAKEFSIERIAHQYENAFNLYTR